MPTLAPRGLISTNGWVRGGSPLPSNSLVVRWADLEDPERLEFLNKYLRGWAMGSEFADRNPRAATDIVFKALPTTKANYGPRAGTESLMQIHRASKASSPRTTSAAVSRR